jgi:rfaE bifunctional protein nucleotidyltransferase chain/domain
MHEPLQFSHNLFCCIRPSSSITGAAGNASGCTGRQVVRPIMSLMSTICSLDQLGIQVAQWRAANLSIGFTCGAFDLLHAGHVDYLARARNLCDRLIVAVNSDDSVRSYKGSLRPINCEQHRIAVIATLSVVDAAILMRESHPESLIKILRPDLYIKGGDYQISQLKSAPVVEGYGGRCVVIPVTHEVSTTKIAARIQQLGLYAEPEPSRRTGDWPVVFLDRDGTLIRNVPFLNSPSKVELLPGVGEGLRKLQDQGFRLVVVTNQQGLGLGYFDYETFVQINSRMFELLSPYGIKISRFYFCPHSSAENCECRKPGTKLIALALAYFGARPEQCFFIGDSDADMMCARRAGCHGILVGRSAGAASHVSVTSFRAAVDHVLNTRCLEASSV